MTKGKEQNDICKFCVDLWGEDKRKGCHSSCVCATYANQDWVNQHELTIGLPVLRPWNPSLVPVGPPAFLAKLSQSARERLSLKLAKLVGKTGPVLRSMLVLLLEGKTREEICKALNIKDKIYDKYAERLRKASRSI